MLLYQYPNSETVVEEKRNLVKDYNDKKKIKKNVITNLIIAVAIIIIAIFVEMLFAKILLCLIALLIFCNSIFIYRCAFPKKSKYLITQIFDDKIVNAQYDFFQQKIYRYTINYDIISKTTQTLLGGLKFDLNNSIKCEIIKKDGTVLEREYAKDYIILNLNDSKSKYVLIKDNKEKIKYALN